MLVVFKSGSSVLFVIASAVRLPLVDLMLLSSFIAGNATETFTLYDGFALFALVMAISVYYSEPEQAKGVPSSARKIPQDEEAPTVHLVPLQKEYNTMDSSDGRDRDRDSALNYQDIETDTV